jgi:hypothetical protein
VAVMSRVVQLEIALNPEGDDRTDARERVAHHNEEGMVTEADEPAGNNRSWQSSIA